MSENLGLVDIYRLTGGHLGVTDVPCPHCGPERNSPANRVRPVLRIWHDRPDFAAFSCARCGLRGHARNGAVRLEPNRIAEIRNVIAERGRAQAAAGLVRAHRLAARLLPAKGTLVETYLREIRGFGGRIPETIGFLPATEQYPPAMIATFGLPTEPEPGILHLPLEQITGIHLTRLQADGRGKAGNPSKIMIGPSTGSPIVLAPPNDQLGLVVAEGVETGLSIVEATGCGVWVAGSASRMPALAAVVPQSSTP